MNSLDQAIIKTLVFFDVFKYPLTVTEIWKWLYRPSRNFSLSEVKEALENSDFLKDKTSSREGFYSLKGESHRYHRRKHNNNLAERKFRRAIWLAKVYRFIPFIKMIAICNTLAYSNVREDSDIDLFIITQKNKIWLARFFALLFIRMFGQRPEPDNKKDAFCLSFFVDESEMNIESSMFGKDDIYYPYWVSQLMPIYDPDKLYPKFLEANKWYREHLPNSYNNKFSKEVKTNLICKISGKILQFILCPPFLCRYVKNLYRAIQVRVIDRNLKSLINVDTRVMVTNHMLKFYPNDNRELFARRWREKLKRVLGAE